MNSVVRLFLVLVLTCVNIGAEQDGSNIVSVLSSVKKSIAELRLEDVIFSLKDNKIDLKKKKILAYASAQVKKNEAKAGSLFASNADMLQACTGALLVYAGYLSFRCVIFLPDLLQDDYFIDAVASKKVGTKSSGNDLEMVEKAFRKQLVADNLRDAMNGVSAGCQLFLGLCGSLLIYAGLKKINSGLSRKHAHENLKRAQAIECFINKIF